MCFPEKIFTPVTSRPLEGRTALVTGGARRVGAEIVRTLAGAGARVAVHHRRSGDEAARLIAGVRDDGGDARSFAADLSSPAAIAGLFDALADAAYLPDLVVNSASNFLPSSDEEPDPDVWNASLAVNLTAPYLISMHAARRLGGKSGDVVNIADVWGTRPLAGHVAYSVSKAGLLMLTRSLARALAPRIRVNAVAPGPVLLPESYGAKERERAIRRTLLGREGTPGDVARAVLFLVAGTDYATGSVITVDGGRQVL